MQFYSEEFKDAAAAKMAAQGGRSATSLSQELGVAAVGSSGERMG